VQGHTNTAIQVIAMVARFTFHTQITAGSSTADTR